MGPVRRFKVREHERGLLFKDREFKARPAPGPPLRLGSAAQGPRGRRVGARRLARPQGPGRDRASRARWATRPGSSTSRTTSAPWCGWTAASRPSLKPGLYALWTVFHDVRVEVFDARAVRFEHADLAVIAQARGAAPLLEAVDGRGRPRRPLLQGRPPRGDAGPGRRTPSGRASAKARILDVDLREQVVDVAGQEIMTADKVTLRLNAVVTYKVADPAEGGHHGGGLPSGPLPRGAARAARRHRHARAGRAPERQGRGRPGAGRHRARPRRRASASRSWPSASAT